MVIVEVAKLVGDDDTTLEDVAEDSEEPSEAGA